MLIVLALSTAGIARVLGTSEPTLLDIAPFLAAILTVPLAYARDFFTTDDSTEQA